jgi:copper chaperone
MHKVEVENLKCNGCAGTIQKGLNAIDGVSDLSIDIETKIIAFNSDEKLIETIKQKLGKMGYPEKGTGTGLQKAKSYVSCAIGKIEN